MLLPQRYVWLLNEGAPRMLLKGLELYGVSEVVGNKHNPIIMAWAHEVGLEKIYVADEIPWCGLFHLIRTTRAHKEIPFKPKDALWAFNWQAFGSPPGTRSADGTVSLSEQIANAMLDDTLVFRRPEGGHVATYVGENHTHFYTLGGNQGNAVSIVTIPKDRCVAVRRPHYENQPANVRKIFLNDIGAPVSTNEL